VFCATCFAEISRDLLWNINLRRQRSDVRIISGAPTISLVCPRLRRFSKIRFPRYPRATCSPDVPVSGDPSMKELAPLQEGHPWARQTSQLPSPSVLHWMDGMKARSALSFFACPIRCRPTAVFIGTNGPAAAGGTGTGRTGNAEITRTAYGRAREACELLGKSRLPL
jgi:hypothetical protein